MGEVSATYYRSASPGTGGIMKKIYNDILFLLSYIGYVWYFIEGVITGQFDSRLLGTCIILGIWGLDR